MKIKQLFFSGLLTALLCVVGTNYAVATVTYSLNTTTKTLTFTGTGAMDNYTDPDGSGSPRRPATWVFNVQTIVIEEGVTSIGEWVFAGLTNLKYIYIPTSVTTINERAFSGCTTLESIYYAGTPNQWAQIDFIVTGSYCYSHPFCASTASARKFYFYNQTTKETVDLTFSAGITQIKPYAFYKANDIVDVYIPGTVTTIGTHALDCSIKRIYINKSVAPTTGTTAISWLTSGTYIYLRSDATNSYNKQPWINSTSRTSTGAKTIGYSDYSTTYVACSWKTGKLHKVSGTVNSINWSLSEDGTLTLSGSGAIATTFSTTTSSSALLPWYRFRRLINNVVIKSTGSPITGISNALNWCTMMDDITIAQTYVPAASMSGYLLASDANFYQYRMSTDKINVYGDTSSDGNEAWDTAPWNDSRLNVSFTTTFCGDPSALNISNIGTTTATASWTDDSGDSWKYICQPSASAAPTSSAWASAATTTSKSVNLTGLTPGAKYKFYLISDCGSVGTSNVIVSSEFSTDCEIISSLPWNEGFENSTDNALPLCWKQITNNNSKVYAYNSAINAHSNNFSMILYGGGSNRTIIAIFPEFEDDIKGLALSFWYKTSVTGGGYTYGQPQLGYITDPNDANTFEDVGDMLNQTSDYTRVENFVVPSNTPNGAFFAIRYSGGLDNTGYAYIDDITVTAKPACSKPTEMSVVADSETAEGATITWNANGMSAWKLQVSEGDAASWGEEIAVATNSKVLTGLNANTLYYVRVKADCGGGSVSEWSDNVSFTTLCGTISVNASTSWNMDFEDLSDHIVPDCWDNSASTTTSSWGAGYIWGTYSRFGNTMLAMDNSVLNDGTALMNTPAIAIPNDGNTYELTFDHSNMASAGNNLIVKISANGGAFADKGTYYPSGNVSSYPGTFTKATISLADYSGKTIKIQFFANPTSGTSSEGGAMFVDNVSVHKEPTCFAPTALTFSDLTSASAQVSWTNGGEESAWRLQYRTTEGSWSAEQVVSSKPYMLTGLSANTEYMVRVKSHCAADDQSEWSEVGSFTTLCAAASMPFEENFSSASELPSCWEATSTVSNGWSAYEKSGAYSVQLRTGSSGEAELRMPAISLSEAAILRFEWKNASGANADIYISTNGGTTKTLLANDLSNVHSDWTTKTFDLSAYTGETVLIYFKSLFSAANNYAYLDDIEVVARPCDMILNIQATPVTGGATISWSGNVKKLQYKTGSDAWSSVTIPSGEYSGPKDITGLTPARTYQVRLLAACSEEAEGNWTTPVFFMSNSVESTPYYNDFESETAGEVPFNWSRVSASEYPQISHDAYAYHETFGEQGNSIKFYGVNEQIIVLPEFSTALQDLSISLHYRNRDCKMELGYVASDGTTFTAIATLPNQTGYGEFPYEKVLKNISASAYKLAIRYSEATGASSQAFVDNVRVEEPTCGQPEALTLGTVTANSVELSWSVSELGTEDQYQYILRTWNESDPNWASATLLNGVRSISRSGLSANTNYEFYVRSYCDASNQSTPVHIEFRTEMLEEVFEDVASATNNETRLAALVGQTLNITINRPLTLNGDYCTLTLPFNLSASQIADPECPLHGFVIKEFESSEEKDGAVNVYLTQVYAIEAGKPYFVRYGGAPSGSTLTPLQFKNVTVACSTPEAAVDGGFTPHGVFNPYSLIANDASTLFLSSANTLYYPSANGTMNGFRAYIKVSGSMGAPIRRGAPVRICERENVATGVIDNSQKSKAESQKSKVLIDGQLLIIRDGKTYNAQGQLIR